MKVLLAVAAVALCTLAPGVASACEYDDTSAAATPPTQLGLAPAPAASKAPAQSVVKASNMKAAKQTAKIKTGSDAKIAAVTTR